MRGGGACGESRDPYTVCIMADKYEPAAVRYGHVAAAVEDKVYVWGGRRYRYTEDSHDGPDKTKIIFEVHILDVKVRICMTGLLFNRFDSIILGYDCV